MSRSDCSGDDDSFCENDNSMKELQSYKMIKLRCWIYDCSYPRCAYPHPLDGTASRWNPICEVSRKSPSESFPDSQSQATKLLFQKRDLIGYQNALNVSTQELRWWIIDNQTEHLNLFAIRAINLGALSPLCVSIAPSKWRYDKNVYNGPPRIIKQNTSNETRPSLPPATENASLHHQTKARLRKRLTRTHEVASNYQTLASSDENFAFDNVAEMRMRFEMMWKSNFQSNPLGDDDNNENMENTHRAQRARICWRFLWQTAKTIKFTCRWHRTARIIQYLISLSVDEQAIVLPFRVEGLRAMSGRGCKPKESIHCQVRSAVYVFLNENWRARSLKRVPAKKHSQWSYWYDFFHDAIVSANACPFQLVYIAKCILPVVAILNSKRLLRVCPRFSLMSFNDQK